MKQIKFYLLTILVLFTSVLLLGLSYSKESGHTDNAELISETIENIKLNYSRQNIFNKQSSFILN